MKRRRLQGPKKRTAAPRIDDRPAHERTPREALEDALRVARRRGKAIDPEVLEAARRAARLAEYLHSVAHVLPLSASESKRHEMMKAVGDAWTLLVTRIRKASLHAGFEILAAVERKDAVALARLVPDSELAAQVVASWNGTAKWVALATVLHTITGHQIRPDSWRTKFAAWKRTRRP